MTFSELEIGAVFWYRDKRYRKVALSMSRVDDPAYPEEEGWHVIFHDETEVEPETRAK